MSNSKNAVAFCSALWYNIIDKVIPIFSLEVIHMGKPRTNVNADDIIREYNSGKSVKALANQFGVSRNVIIQRLHSAGIQQRNRSEAMYLRMSQTSQEERKNLAKAANIAKRGSKNTPEMLHKRALAKKRFVGAFEQEFIDAISAAGIVTFPQEPFLSYNLDIGCGDIAVEIHTQCASPLTTKFIKKVMNCVNSGKSMIYVWISPRNFVATPECYEKVIATIQEFRRNPPSRSQYWVIRGTGEIYAAGCFD